MKIPQYISDILATLPSSPGIYCMKNRAGTVIYVGKSINLHSRVSSYWGDEKRLNFSKQSMVAQVRDIEIVETRNELEALVLEANLIKEKQPKYNILLKDGKNLSYIHVTSGQIPEVVKTRTKKKGGAYFGPYTAGANVTEVLKILKRVFGIRSCGVEFVEKPIPPTPLNKGDNDSSPLLQRRGAGGWGVALSIGNKAGRSIPCLDHSIGLCPAPCLLTEEKIKTYQENITTLKQFLSGRSIAVVEQLRQKMMEKAKKLEFEEAQKIKLQIEQIEKLGTKQIARDSIPGDYDAIISVEKYAKNFIGLTEIRSGHIVGVSQLEVDNQLGETAEEVLSAFLAKRYLTEDVPESVKILLKKEPEDPVLLEALSERKRELEYPQIGPKMDVLKFVEYNLLSFAQREEMRSLSVKSPTRATQVSILEKLGYELSPSPTLPPRERGMKKEIVFECYDISHTHGQFTVASRSVTVNGKSENSRYRKYKIKTLQPGMIDDFASIREVLYRRTLEGIEQNNFPDMIIIDGGKGQLSSAREAMERGYEHALTPTLSQGEREKVELPYLCSIAKREEEVFVPFRKDPVIFQKGSLELMLLQKIRDEAHRFAIGFNRSSRNKALKKNILEELPGFGPVARKNILKLAGSIDNLPEVPREDLQKVLTKKQMETLEEHGLI